MNDTFNLKRFGWLFKKTLLERPVQMFGPIGLTLIVSILTYVVCRYLFGFEPGQNVSFIFGLVGGGEAMALFKIVGFGLLCPSENFPSFVIRGLFFGFFT